MRIYSDFLFICLYDCTKLLFLYLEYFIHYIGLHYIISSFQFCFLLVSYIYILVSISWFYYVDITKIYISFIR